MNLILTIIFFVVIISVVVSIHELGHFLTAKYFRMTVNEFAIGFGKILFSKTYKGTRYSIRAIPFGGFVELEGEDSSKDLNNFRNRPFYQKVLVLVAGVVMNLLLAVVLLTFHLSTNNYTFLSPNLVDYSFNNVESQNSYIPIRVSEVKEGGRSEGVLEPGDTIVEVNGEAFKTYDEFSTILKENQGEDITLTFLNSDTFDTATKTYKLGVQNEEGAILDAVLSPSNTPLYLVKYNNNITSGVSMTYDVFVYQVKAIGSLIQKGTQTGDYSDLSNSVGGLPRITDEINTAVEFNAIGYLIPLTGFISISLAFFNILPFPALDGGQIVIAFIEKLRRKKISDELLNKINLGGFIFLIGLGILINLKDIITLGWVNQLFESIRTVLGR